MSYLDDIVSEENSEEFLLYIWDSVVKVFEKHRFYPSGKFGLIFYYYEEWEGVKEGKIYSAAPNPNPSSSSDEEDRGNLFLSPIHSDDTFEIIITQYPSNGSEVKTKSSIESTIKNLIGLVMTNEKRNTSLGEDIRKSLSRVTIQIPDQKNNSYEVILKNLKVSIDYKSVRHKDRSKHLEIPFTFTFLFELVNITALEPPFDSIKGGEEYERIKERTLIGK